MSICVAGFNWGDRAIVGVSDKMLSTSGGDITAENAAIKQFYVHTDWFVMFAGSDIGPSVPS